MPNLRVLKLAVAGMTVLIVLMLAGVIWGISRNAREVQAGLARLEQAAPPVWQARIPEGRIMSLAPAGNALAVMAAAPAGTNIYLFDPHDGRLLGTLTESVPGAE